LNFAHDDISYLSRFFDLLTPNETLVIHMCKWSVEMKTLK